MSTTPSRAPCLSLSRAAALGLLVGSLGCAAGENTVPAGMALPEPEMPEIVPAPAPAEAPAREAGPGRAGPNASVGPGESRDVVQPARPGAGPAGRPSDPQLGGADPSASGGAGAGASPDPDETGSPTPPAGEPGDKPEEGYGSAPEPLVACESDADCTAIAGGCLITACVDRGPAGKACEPVLLVCNCVPGWDASCSDGDPCTADLCAGTGDCESAPAPAVCEDGNACTSDLCLPASGCQHQPMASGAACSDNSACTASDLCQAGKCQAGAALDCDDGQPCTWDWCEASSGCRHDPLPAAACLP